jgi:hypothetical protein
LRVALAEMNVFDDAVMTVGSQVIVNQPMAFDASSSVVIDGIRVQNQGFTVSCVSEMSVSARKKWENESDTTETWTGIDDTSESWTAVSDTSESWTDIDDTTETWVPISDNTETWQIAA